MSRIEYRVETIPANGHVVDALQRLDELGHDGWRASTLQGEAYGLAPTQVLLERDLPSGKAFRRLFASRSQTS